MSAMRPILQLQNLRKAFGGIPAIDGLSLDLAPGSLTAVIGPNGAGKTTMFNLIGGQLKPDSGTICLKGMAITSLAPAQIARRGMVRAFQIAQIFPELTVQDALAATLTVRANAAFHIVTKFPGSTVRREAERLMQNFDLINDARTWSGHLPHGAKKRLDLALAVALRPNVLLLDEPAAGLGQEGRAQMMAYIKTLWKDEGITVLLVEHDMDLVFMLAPRIVVLNFGQVLADGAPEEIRCNPKVVEAYLGEEARGTASC